MIKPARAAPLVAAAVLVAALLSTAAPASPKTLKKTAAVTYTYVCPMHPTVKSTRAGTCPKCHMKLEKRAVSAGAGAKAAPTTYVCPMDPEVKSSKPGRCPKCRMDLVKKAR